MDAAKAAARTELRDESRLRYTQRRAAHWNAVARELDGRPGAGRYYHQRLAHLYRALVPPGLKVLELGCGAGDLLAALDPAVGVGVDLSAEMIQRARERYPTLTFLRQDVHELELQGSFDVVILSDLVNDLWDVQAVLEAVRPVCAPSTRLLLNCYSRLWEIPLALAEKLRLARPVLRQNWITPEDVRGLLRLSGFEALRTSQEVLWPLATPLVAEALNVFAGRLWPFRHLALTNLFVARPAPGRTAQLRKPPLVSVIVPARNEAGNIRAIFERTPEMGGGTELVFVEGGSSDGTYEEIERAIREHPRRRARLFRQKGKGKGDAVRLGFDRAEGDVLMILDADLTVPPEDLPRFYEALRDGRGEFINGVRLVYPMEDQAMRFLNLLANHFFSLLFSWLMGQHVKDTLCGTKVLWKRDYERISASRAHFGDFDPFGDFDLLFGAAKQNLKILDLPVRYRQRTYGSTNIRRFRDGLLLLRMAGVAARRLKFI